MKLLLLCVGLLACGALIQALDEECTLPNCNSCIDYKPECAMCPDRTAKTDNLVQCVDCPENCHECTAPTSAEVACTRCFDEFVITSGTCTACPGNCMECTSANECKTCKTGFFVDTDKSCKSCPDRCDECSNGDSCSRCNSNAYEDAEGNCKACPNNAATCSLNGDKVSVERCNSGFVRNDNAEVCLTCPADCSSCLEEVNIGSTAKCDGCKSDHYQDGVVCNDCTTYCATCSNNADCSLCKEDYTDKPTEVQTCQVCTKSNCIDCTLVAGAAEVCTACRTGYRVESGSCESCVFNCDECDDEFGCKADKCSSGYDDQSLGDGNFTCIAIPTNCETLLQSSTANSATCATCKDGFYDNGDECGNTCFTNCAVCTNGTECITCSSGFDQQTDSSGDQQCLSLTGNCVALNATANSDTPVCIDCADGFRVSGSSCASCSVSRCADCDDDAATCTRCRDGYWKDGNTCIACTDTLSNCARCSSSSTCTTCEAGYGLKDGSCSACGTSCAECFLNADLCEACEGDKVKLLNGACYEYPSNCDDFNLVDSSPSCTDCSITYGLVNGECTKCPLLCDDCGNVAVDSAEHLSCTDCSDGYGRYSHVCAACPENCEECDYRANSGVECSKCEDGYTVVGGLCEACPLNCEECSSTTTCDECVSGYGLNFQKTGCVDCATLTKIENCMHCEDHPAYANDTAGCKRCNSGFYLKDNLRNGTDAACMAVADESTLNCGDGVMVIDKPPMCLKDSCVVGFMNRMGRCVKECLRCGDTRIGSRVAPDQCETDNSTGQAMYDYCEDGVCYGSLLTIGGVNLVNAGCSPPDQQCINEKGCSDTSDGRLCVDCCSTGSCNIDADDISKYSSATCLSTSLTVFLLLPLLMLLLR